MKEKIFVEELLLSERLKMTSKNEDVELWHDFEIMTLNGVEYVMKSKAEYLINNRHPALVPLDELELSKIIMPIIINNWDGGSVNPAELFAKIMSAISNKFGKSPAKSVLTEKEIKHFLNTIELETYSGEAFSLKFAIGEIPCEFLAKAIHDLLTKEN